MAGFKLPKLRWLLIGAAATGIWAATQEPPKRDHWQRRDAAEAKAYEEARTPRRERPTPAVAAAPAPKPSSLKTASIPRPEVKVPQEETLRVTEKVRLRKAASTSSDVVALLAAGTEVLGSETEGRWRRVRVNGKTGWVHSDYLGRLDPIADIVASVPRPSEPIPNAEPAEAEPQPASMPVGPEPVDASIWGAMRPLRAPQGGDCQCPYDLMLSGKECGTRSAYSRGKAIACYF
jgi:hypothetical protein